MMNVVDPSPSRDTAPARTAVNTTKRTGSLFTARSTNRINGSNNPTSIIVPKKMIAKNNNTAVGAKSFIAAVIDLTTPSSPDSATPVPTATRANVNGTNTSANVGARRFDKIKNMKAAIIADPRAIST